MLSIDKLASLAGMGTTIANVALLKRFLSGMAVIIALTAMCSTIVGMFMVTGLYMLYLSLVRHGFDPVFAGLAISGTALLLVVIFCTVAIWRWYKLKEMPGLLHMEQPIINRVTKIADSFVTGLLAGRSQRD